MSWRKISAQPVSGPGNVDRMSDGKMVPSIEMDDQTGEFWVGGRKLSQAVAGSLHRHLPQGIIGGGNTSFVFPGAPADETSFFLIWNGMFMGPDDFSLVGETVITNFTPKDGDNLFGVY